MIHPVYICRKENAGLIDKICAELNINSARKLVMEHFELARFVKSELKSYRFQNPFIIDLSCCEEKGDDLISYLQAITYQIDNVKIIIYASGYYAGDDLLDKLVKIGITDIVANYDDVDEKKNLDMMLTDLKECISEDGLSAKKWRRYDRSYDARAEARAAAMLQERESAKPRYTQAKLRIAVVGAQPRIGATSYAIRLAAYFRSRGAEAAVICTDPRRDMQLDMLCDVCDGAANSNGSYTIRDIDFYTSTTADIGDCAVAIYDCGDIAGALHSFGDFDKLYLVGGTSWSELPMIYQAQTELNAANYTAVINFSTPEQIKRCHDILSLNLNEVICAPFEPNAFAFAAYEDIFDKMFDSCRDRDAEQTEDEAAEEY